MRESVWDPVMPLNPRPVSGYFSYKGQDILFSVKVDWVVFLSFATKKIKTDAVCNLCTKGYRT